MNSHISQNHSGNDTVTHSCDLSLCRRLTKSILTTSSSGVREQGGQGVFSEQGETCSMMEEASQYHRGGMPSVRAAENRRIRWKRNPVGTSKGLPNP